MRRERSRASSSAGTGGSPGRKVAPAPAAASTLPGDRRCPWWRAGRRAAEGTKSPPRPGTAGPGSPRPPRQTGSRRGAASPGAGSPTASRQTPRRRSSSCTCPVDRRWS